MANRFPLIFNSGAGQIQELAASDNLDLTSSNLVNAGILFTSSGSQTAPSISIGNGTTYPPGLYSPGADQLAVATNGTGKVLVDTNGTILVNTTIQATSNGGLNIENTGAGTFTTPLALLNRGTTNNTGVTLSFRGLSAASAETDYAYLRMLATDTTSRHGRIEFWTANSGTVTEKLCITRDGLVGINTASPGSRLEIGGDASYDAKVTFNRVPVQASNDGVIGELFFQNNADSVALIAVKRQSAADDAYIQFATQQTSGGLSEKMRLTSTGALNFVGAGTAGSTQAVSFNGSAPVNSLVIDSSGRLGIGTGSPAANLQVNAASDVTIALSNSSSVTSGNRGNISMFNSATSSVGLIRFAAVTDNVGTEIQFYTRPAAGSLTQTMTLDSAGRLGIGIIGPSERLAVANGNISHLLGTTSATVNALYDADTASNTYRINVRKDGADACALAVITQRSGGSTSEAARIDSSGRLLVGTSSVINNAYGGTAGLFQVSKDDFLPIGFFSFTSTAADGYCPYLELHRARGTKANPTIVSSGDELGEINFYGYDGSVFRRGASIRSYVDAAPGSDDMPSCLTFYTSANGSATPTERMRITSAGLVGIGTGSPSSKLDVTVPVNIPSTGSPDAGSFITARGNTATVGYGPSFALSNVSGAKETSWRISAVTASSNNGDLVFNGYNGGADFPERMRITAGGLVGIGTASLSATLHVNGTTFANSTADGIALLETGTSGSAVNQYMILSHSPGAGAYSYTSLKFGTTEFLGAGENLSSYAGAVKINAPNSSVGYVQFSIGTAEKARITSAGLVGIGTTNPTSKLHVIGDALVSGIITATTFQSTSDINLKENIKTVNNSLNIVSQLRGVTFDWKNTHQASIGVIAQEVEQILPELVSGGENKTVNYNGIIGILVEAIKEQEVRIEKLENKLNAQ